jgi:hypothetical protein
MSRTDYASIEIRGSDCGKGYALYIAYSLLFISANLGGFVDVRLVTNSELNSRKRMCRNRKEKTETGLHASLGMISTIPHDQWEGSRMSISTIPHDQWEGSRMSRKA